MEEKKSEGDTVWTATYQKGNRFTVNVTHERPNHNVGDKVLVMHQPGQDGYEITTWSAMPTIVVLGMHILVVAALFAYILAMALPQAVPAWVPGTLLTLPCIAIVGNLVKVHMV